MVMKYLSETKIQQEMWMGKTHGKGAENQKLLRILNIWLKTICYTYLKQMKN